MLAVLVRMLKDRQVAEDALQDSMIAVWDAADTYEPQRAKVSTWMISIARYRALDQLRKLGRYREVLQEDQTEINVVLGSGPESNPLSGATIERLENCFSQLSENASTCIQFAYLGGYSASEIAKKISKPLGSVKSWIRRGLVTLRECVEL
ncbi:MAG: sigma-70 family RNA polymerase sigma factor [Gammaproteobacteria bacterium]|nr:sigma-70 family RNA polymerase sigma factor [Gammaproteobacteria bacterium]NNC97483.1 sigma-70 family RNA polymerase sigma factor [Gammaproteobacteria bacterium]